MKTIHTRHAAALAALLLLASGCARTEEASLVPPESEEGYNAVERVRTPESDDEEVAIGEWRRSVQDEQQVLEFGPAGATPLFSIQCQDRGGLVLQRHGTVPVGDLPMMMVQVGSDVRRLAVTTAGDTVPLLRAEVAPSDDLVETLATAGGPITVRIGDAVPLIMPADPTIAQFVADCQAGRAGAAAMPGNAVEAAPAEAGPEAAQPSG